VPDGLGALAIEAAVVVIFLVLLLVWLLTRDAGVARTSFGFHVERVRKGDPRPLPPPTPPPPLPPRPDAETEAWPKREGA
jgi:hypothetical protein